MTFDFILNNLTSIGLFIDIIGSYFVLKTFFSLAKKGDSVISFSPELLNKKHNNHPTSNDFSEYQKLSYLLPNFITSMKLKKETALKDKDLLESFGEMLKNKIENKEDMKITPDDVEKNDKLKKALDYGIYEENFGKIQSYIDETFKNFYHKLGRDALIGFILLTSGFFLQILGQFI